MVEWVKKNIVRLLLLAEVAFLIGQIIAYQKGYENLSWVFFAWMCTCLLAMLVISRFRGEVNGEE